MQRRSLFAARERRRIAELLLVDRRHLADLTARAVRVLLSARPGFRLLDVQRNAQARHVVLGLLYRIATKSVLGAIAMLGSFARGGPLGDLGAWKSVKARSDRPSRARSTDGTRRCPTLVAVVAITTRR
jgi:hypothetical protein